MLDATDIAYQESIAKACGVAFDARILAFNKVPEQASGASDRLIQNWAQSNNRVQKKTHRRIPLLPEKVLDAPGIADDFYLNLLCWSSSNLLAVGLDKNVYIWDATTGSVNDFCQTADDDYISSINFAPDGSFLAVGTSHGDVEIWDVSRMAKVRSMRGHQSRIGVMSWDRNLLSSGARDGSIWNHDVRVAQHKVAEMHGHTSEVCGLEWRPDGNFLASGGNDNLVQIWDARSSVPRSTKTAHLAAVKVFFGCNKGFSVVSLAVEFIEHRRRKTG